MHTPDDVRMLLARWNQALASERPDQVVALYADDAILVPTLSSRIRRNPDEIRDYFAWFLSHKPLCTLSESSVRIHGDIAIATGTYSFVFGGGDGPEMWVRFTFVYLYRDGAWAIIEHHSSRMPED